MISIGWVLLNYDCFLGSLNLGMKGILNKGIKDVMLCYVY